MGKTKKRQEDDASSSIEGKQDSGNKRRKMNAVAETTSTATIPYERPKSKKELRADKKAARKAAAEAAEPKDDKQRSLSNEKYKELKQRQRKEKRKRLLKEQLREERKEKKIRQQRRMNRKLNAPVSKGNQQQIKERDAFSSEPDVDTKKKDKSTKERAPQEEQAASMKVLGEVMHGSTDESSGMTTLRLGVQYKDLVVGREGAGTVKNKSLVTVSYKLTGGRFGTVLDSSKNFKFRVGKGEVIQAWDIALLGMREGGRRKLIVPPKAGYGSQDIGAGPGGMLYFDIMVLSVRDGTQGLFRRDFT